MVVRGVGAVYALVVLVLSVALGVLGGYLAVSGYPLVAAPALVVAGVGLCHAGILLRWLRTPAQVAAGPVGLRISSPALLRSAVVVEWADIELAWLRTGVSSLPADTIVLAPLAVSVDVLLRLSADVSLDARRWPPRLLDPMGSWYGAGVQMPRPGRSCRRLAWRMPSRDALDALEAELRAHGVPIGG